ncbi:MAG: hypothetical protein LBH24_00740 [Clostridiales bacterium]|jgi:hypothetical protein|nr:hypothetical protein [Clostridiales bacterium]
MIKITCAHNDLMVDEAVELTFSEKLPDGQTKIYKPEDIEMYVRRGESDAIDFRAGRISFKAKGDFFLRFYPKEEIAKAAAFDFYVIEREKSYTGRVYGCGADDLPGKGEEVTGALLKTAGDKTGEELFEHLKDENILIVETETKIKLDTYYQKGEKTADIRITPIPVIRIMKN